LPIFVSLKITIILKCYAKSRSWAGFPGVYVWKIFSYQQSSGGHIWKPRIKADLRGTIGVDLDLLFLLESGSHESGLARANFAYSG
jgi:hypothetical protein